MRRLIVLPVAAVIVWAVVLFVHAVHLATHHHDTRPGVVSTLVVLPLLVAACAWVAVGLWRHDRS